MDDIFHKGANDGRSSILELHETDLKKSKTQQPNFSDEENYCRLCEFSALILTMNPFVIINKSNLKETKTEIDENKETNINHPPTNMHISIIHDLKINLDENAFAIFN